MPNNIITAIINFVRNPHLDLIGRTESRPRNRANQMGTALETYVKELFASTLDITTVRGKLKRWVSCFSYLGNQNNPPDMMIRGGDAIEVKKVEGKVSALALNSSYPKCKLFASSSLLTDACRVAEDSSGGWAEKDIIYVVGSIKQDKLKNLCMVYGMDYAADIEIYERIMGSLKEGVEQIPNIEFAETNELGKVNRVDPLGITDLRIRGMWSIKIPWKVFDYVYTPPEDSACSLFVIINNDKYASLTGTEELEALQNDYNRLKIEDVEIKDPNNPARLKPAKLITFSV